MKKFRRAASFIGSVPTLRAMEASLREQQKLLALVRSLVPPVLAPHCLSAQPQGNQLLVYVDSSAWASRLRFFSRDLRARLGSSGWPVTKITVRVLLGNQNRPVPVRSIEPLSEDSASLIEAVAEQVHDAGLSAALRRLSRHRRK